MKKLIALVLMLCLLPLFASAEMNAEGEVVVALEGATFSFTPAEELICLTRESSASVFNRFGLSQRETVPLMEQSGVYALLTDEMYTCEIQIAALPATDENYNEMTGFGEEMTRSGFEHYYQECGYDVLFCDVYNAYGGHKFIRTCMSELLEDGTPDHMVEYLTCYGGYAVSIVMFTYEIAPTQEQLDMCDALADSMWIMPDAVILDAIGD